MQCMSSLQELEADASSSTALHLEKGSWMVQFTLVGDAS